MKIINIICICICVLILTSCTTSKLWKRSIHTETIKSFLITKNGNKLVIIGNKYHYIFSINNELKSILLSDRRKHITPLFYSFTIDADNNVNGKYSLYYSSTNNDDTPWLIKSGFIEQKNNIKKIKYSYHSSINGKRYISNQVISSRYRFNKAYYIKIEEQFSAQASIAKMIATPVTASADGLLIISGLVLAPILFTFLLNADLR